MQSDDALRRRRRDSQFHDRNGGGVRGEHRVRIRDHRVELGEDLGLDLLVLRHCLDHELTVGEVAEIAGEAQPPGGLLTFALGDLAAAHAAVQRPKDACASCGRQLTCLLVDQHVDMRAGADLGYAGAHLPGADDAYSLNRHGTLLFSHVAGQQLQVRWGDSAGGTPRAGVIRVRRPAAKRWGRLTSALIDPKEAEQLSGTDPLRWSPSEQPSTCSGRPWWRCGRSSLHRPHAGA